MVVSHFGRLPFWNGRGRRTVVKARRGPRKGRGGRPKKVKEKGTIPNFFHKILKSKDDECTKRKWSDDDDDGMIRNENDDGGYGSKRMKFLHGNGPMTTVMGAKSSTGEELGGIKLDCNDYFSFKKQTSMVNYIQLGRKNSPGNKKQRKNNS